MEDAEEPPKERRRRRTIEELENRPTEIAKELERVHEQMEKSRRQLEEIRTQKRENKKHGGILRQGASVDLGGHAVLQ